MVAGPRGGVGGGAQHLYEHGALGGGPQTGFLELGGGVEIDPLRESGKLLVTQHDAQRTGGHGTCQPAGSHSVVTARSLTRDSHYERCGCPVPRSMAILRPTRTPIAGNGTDVDPRTRAPTTLVSVSPWRLCADGANRYRRPFRHRDETTWAPVRPVGVTGSAGCSSQFGHGASAGSKLNDGAPHSGATVRKCRWSKLRIWTVW